VNLTSKERQPAPTLKAFAQQFLDNAGLGRKQEPKVSTKAFYADALNVMLKFEPLASAKMDSNLPELSKRFLKTTRVGPGRKNAYLRTLRRAAHVAQELGLVRSVPRFPMEQGEREREFVLSPDQESAYLDAAPQPLADAALLMVGTGLCVGEVCGLEWKDVHLEPVQGARLGYLRVREGKTRNRRRNMLLSAAVRAMREARQVEARTPWVFTNSKWRNRYEPGTNPLSPSTLQHQHMRVRQTLELPEAFVIHGLPHTFLTRFGASGADVFSIKRIAGHSSVTVSEKYVHPTPESLERAFQRLEEYNAKSLKEGPKLLQFPLQLPRPMKMLPNNSIVFNVPKWRNWQTQQTQNEILPYLHGSAPKRSITKSASVDADLLQVITRRVAHDSAPKYKPN
jgi:integrase